MFVLESVECICWKYNQSNVVECYSEIIGNISENPSVNKPIVGISSGGITIPANSQMNITIKYYNSEKQTQPQATVVIDKCKSTKEKKFYFYETMGNYPVSVLTMPIDVESNTEVNFPMVLKNINLIAGDKYICKLEIVQNSNTTRIYESLTFFLVVIQ